MITTLGLGVVATPKAAFAKTMEGKKKKTARTKLNSGSVKKLRTTFNVDVSDTSKQDDLYSRSNLATTAHADAWLQPGWSLSPSMLDSSSTQRPNTATQQWSGEDPHLAATVQQVQQAAKIKAKIEENQRQILDALREINQSQRMIQFLSDYDETADDVSVKSSQSFSSSLPVQNDLSTAVKDNDIGTVVDLASALSDLHENDREFAHSVTGYANELKAMLGSKLNQDAQHQMKEQSRKRTNTQRSEVMNELVNGRMKRGFLARSGMAGWHNYQTSVV